MKLFEKYSIPRSVQIHARSVVPPSIKRYDGAHTAPVSLATDIRLEGEGPEQRLVVDTVHTTQGSYTSFFAFGIGQRRAAVLLSIRSARLLLIGNRIFA